MESPSNVLAAVDKITNQTDHENDLFTAVHNKVF